MVERGSLRISQIADLAWMMTQKRGLLLHDPGVGKTPPVCALMYYHLIERKGGTAWVMPKSLMLKNKEELIRFSEFDPEHIQIIDGFPEERAEQFRRPAAVYLMGPKRFAQDWANLKSLQPHVNMVITDEHHLMYSTWKSQQTQRLYQAFTGFRRDLRYDYFFAMTGSILKGRLSSAFPAIHIIEPRYYGSEEGFMAQHAIKDEYGTIIGWRNHEKLQAIFGNHGIRRTFSMEYGAEAKVIQLFDLPLDPVHKSIYDEWHEKALVELQDGFLESPNAAVAVLRARQILACPEHLLISKMVGRTTARDEYIATELEDVKHTGERYVLFSCFVPEIKRLAKLGTKIGLRVGELHGGISGSDRASQELAFREGRLDLLVVNPTVAGIGYNWGFLKRLGFASLSYEDDGFIQAYRRGIRGIRDSALQISIFGYKNTIDWRIRQIIETKSRHANQVDKSYEILELNRAGASI